MPGGLHSEGRLHCGRRHRADRRDVPLVQHLNLATPTRNAGRMLIAGSMVGALFLGQTVGMIRYRVSARRLIQARPEFVDCLDQAWVGHLGLAVYLVPLALAISGAVIGGDFGFPIGFLSGCVAHAILSRVALKVPRPSAGSDRSRVAPWVKFAPCSAEPG